MAETVFGIDFGTTNSLVSVVLGGQARPLLDERQLPHPSVLWYRGEEPLVGRKAREHFDMRDGAVAPGFVRSPKMALRREGPLHIDGREVNPVDAVAAVLRHLRADALRPRDQLGTAFQVERAVMTVPVDFGGAERRKLRAAALRAGLSVVQFVHEPAAALYGYLRQRPDFERELGQFENRVVLVFDWGGGTLDLTLCRVVGGCLLQVASDGANEIGGDVFDEALRNLVRERHARQHDLQAEQIAALEIPGMSARLLANAEDAKIELSETNEAAFFLRSYLRREGAAGTLNLTLGIEEVEEALSGLVNHGLSRIDRLLEAAGLQRTDVALCLATGGMARMPAIKRGLTERFGGRLEVSAKGDRIIAEGASWIAHDELRLALAKPIEVRVADRTERGGTFLPLVKAGQPLPRENDRLKVTARRFYCADPRDGEAIFEFAKPRRVGRAEPMDAREPLSVLSVAVDAAAKAFVERLECEIEIDHDYIAHIRVAATGTGALVEEEFHRLEFALQLPGVAPPGHGDSADVGGGRSVAVNTARSILRPNIVAAGDGPEPISRSRAYRWAIPGDIAATWFPSAFSIFDSDWTTLQREERDFYRSCSICRRTITRINHEGPVEFCTARCGFGPERHLGPKPKTIGGSAARE